jgi:hypothetical protein
MKSLFGKKVVSLNSITVKTIFNISFVRVQFQVFHVVVNRKPECNNVQMIVFFLPFNAY